MSTLVWLSSKAGTIMVGHVAVHKYLGVEFLTDTATWLHIPWYPIYTLIVSNDFPLKFAPSYIASKLNDQVHYNPLLIILKNMVNLWHNLAQTEVKYKIKIGSTF